MKLYMMVSDDSLELPLAVADSIKELAKEVGVSAKCINSALSQQKTGKTKRSRYIVVEVPDND